jgi:hypothetical protein
VVNGWIQCALHCEVQVLRFLFKRGDASPLEVHDWALASDLLTKLQLPGIEVNKSLDFSGCPALLDLELEDSFLAAKEIWSPSLQHMSLTLCDFICLMNLTQIYVPSLVSLKLIYVFGRTPLLESMPLLSTAVIDFCSHFSDDQCDTGSIHRCGLSEAKNLELSASPALVICSCYLLLIFTPLSRVTYFEYPIYDYIGE